jgi:hypothetical protein
MSSSKLITNKTAVRRTKQALLSVLFAISSAAIFSQTTWAQSSTTLRNPLIPGAQWTAPNEAPAQMPLPPPGSGPTPLDVTPGQSGDPTLPPWVTNMPAHTINQQDSQLNLPYTSSTLAAPGMLGPALGSYIPAPPSTPGADPGILPTVANSQYPTAAIVVPVCSGGGLPDGQAPTKRRGGQTTQNFGMPNIKGSMLTDFGQPLIQVSNLAQMPQDSEDGPRIATHIDNGNGVSRNPNLPNAQATTDLYGLRILNKNNLQPQEINAPY